MWILKNKQIVLAILTQKFYDDDDGVLVWKAKVKCWSCALFLPLHFLYNIYIHSLNAKKIKVLIKRKNIEKEILWVKCV